MKLHSKVILLSLALMLGLAGVSLAEQEPTSITADVSVNLNPLSNICSLAINDNILPVNASFTGCCAEGKRPCDCFRDWVMCCSIDGTMEMSMCKCN